MLDSKFTCKGTLPPQLGICWDSQHHPGCLLRVPNKQAVHCKAAASPLPDTGSNIVRAQGIEVTMQEWGGVLRSCTIILCKQTNPLKLVRASANEAYGTLGIPYYLLQAFRHELSQHVHPDDAWAALHLLWPSMPTGILGLMI